MSRNVDDMRSHQKRAALFAAFNCILLCAIADPDPFQHENDFIAKLAARGSAGWWRVGRSCDTCERGLYATRRIKKGHIVGTIAQDECVIREKTDKYLPEFALSVLFDPTINQTYGEYMKTVPAPGQIHSYLSMTPQQAELLQVPIYLDVVTASDAYFRSIIDSLQASAGESGLTWVPSVDLLKHYAAIVISRAFEFYSDPTVDDSPVHAHLCPVLDMLNNESPGNCERVQRADRVIEVVARRNIKKGEELTWAYTMGSVLRPDTQLLSYGYVHDEERPPMSGVDRPDFSVDTAFTPWLDGDNLTNLSQAEAAAELERVRGILDSLPTTEQEDVELLESGQYAGDYYTEVIMKWRVLRKRALRQRTEALQKLLSEL